MQLKAESIPVISNLVSLPGFASYLLSRRLDDFVRLQLKLSGEIRIPLMRFLDEMDEEQKYQIIRQGATSLLEHLAENRAPAYIEDAVMKWRTNRLPLVNREEITAEDITHITYLRKKTFLSFISDYVVDTAAVLELVREIDLFLTEAETAYTNTYISLLKEQIDDHAHFIEKITNTSPGIIYVYDVANKREIYSNSRTTDLLGYTPEEIIAMGSRFVPSMIHPDDMEALVAYEKEFMTARDGEIRSFDYRFLNRERQYRWLRTYETVFKRNADGVITEKIGIAIDLHEQRLVAEKLRQQEYRLLEAQEIAQLGSFTWDLQSQHFSGTAKTFEIMEGPFSDFNAFLSRVAPADQERLKEKLEESFNTGNLNFLYRYLTRQGEKILWTRGRITFENGHPRYMNGTVMDVTEREHLIDKLQQKEAAFNQAEAITHIGNFIWNLKTHEISWSDELYRIYGLQPQSRRIDFDFVQKFTLPEDLQQVKDEFRNSRETASPYDFYYRIRAADGRIRILHSRGKFICNDDGVPVSAIGTAQDVTEKQTLIAQLRRTEKIYRQAEELANIGNWSMDMQDGSLQWTDNLYRIYGLEPGEIAVDADTYLLFVHADDRAMAGEKMDTLHRENYVNFTFRIHAAGKEKILRRVAHVERDESGNPLMVIGTEQDVTERTMLINRLRQSEFLYKQAQSLTHVGNWTLNMETGETTWSDELYSIYGIEEGEILTLELWESFIHPEEKESVMEYLKQCMEKRQPYDRIHRIVLRDGTVKVLHRKGEFIFDSEGKVLKMIGTTQDITRQHRTEQELRENQIFVRKITDATPSIIASYNINTGKYVFISEGLEKLLGYSTREVMEKGLEFFRGIIHPDDVEIIQEKNRRALEESNADPLKNDLVVEFTYRMRHSNGQYRWFHTYGTIFDRNSEGRVEHVLNISLDITEQKQASEKLAEQEYFIQQIADASPTILYLYDTARQSFVYMNREIFFVLGYLPEEVVEMGEEIVSLYHPEDFHLLPERQGSGKIFQQVDSMIQYECRMKHKDGDWRWFLCREIVFRVNAEGKTEQILGAALDINRRKEMERTILQNTMLLQQSNASLEEFAYVASHDLKEPLRKISTFGDRLLASQTDQMTPEGKIYLSKIVDASQRMQTMISDLLSISMITGNKSFEKYSLKKIIEEVIQTLEYKIEQQGAVVRYDELPEANIIPSQMRQLFQNLLSNSLKFVREDVQPVIIIRHSWMEGDEMIHFQVASADRYHRIEFMDNGIGFEKEFAGKIFAIFQRLHGRSEYEGSGIGLAICKKIAEHHGGIIYATGEPGAGASFTLILPA